MRQNSLSYATPESLGIPSGAVTGFLDDLADKGLCMHGFLLLRGGKVAAEGYWPPFDENRKHRMYSVSKSFTSVAVGMMIGAGKLSLDSRAAEFFPEYLSEGTHAHTLSATVRDLLMMATCNENTSYTHDSDDFSEAFFADPGPKHKPGMIFSYDTAATTVLCAIVEKLSGKDMLATMRPVLDEIGFSDDAWCVKTPEGRSWTGSGILCTARDLARFALLCANEGAWNGKQLVDRAYMRAAVSRQIDNAASGGGPEFRFGYGYQFWRIRGGGFAMYGMGCQLALCMPKEDAILITVADTQGTAEAEGLVCGAFFRLLERFSSGPLQEDPPALAELNKRIGELALPLPRGECVTPMAGAISGRKYVLDENKAGMKWLRLVISPERCRLQYENASGAHELVFGMGRYEPQLFPERYYGKRIGVRDAQYRCIGAGAWTDRNALLCTLYSVDDHLGSIRIILSFGGDEVCGYMIKAAEWFFDAYQGFLSGRAEPGHG